MPICYRTFNHIWESGNIPSVWKESIIIPISKPGESTCESNSFRPISLISCVAKTMERMVNRRLMNHLEVNGILNQQQYAFRKGKRTTHYLADLYETIAEAAERGEHCEIVTLDISKAYDRVWHRHIMETVIDCDLGTNMNKFTNNFLQQRSARVSFSGVLSKLVHLENGVPQGSVLSVSLFLLAMNSVFKFAPKNVKVFLYADDIVFIASGKRVSYLRRRL